MRYVLSRISHYSILLIAVFLPFQYFWVGEADKYSMDLVTVCAACYFMMRIGEVYRYGVSVTRNEVYMMSVLVIVYTTFAAQGVFQTSYIDDYDFDSRTFTFNFLIVNTIWLFAGAAVSRYEARGNFILSILYVTPVMFFIFSATNAEFSIDYSLVSSVVGEPVNHLYVSDYVAYLCFIAYGFAGKFRVFVLAIMVALLFSLGGRTTLYVAPVAIGLYELLNLNRRDLPVFIFVSTLVAISFFLVLQNDQVQQVVTESERMTFDTGISDDNSLIARIEFMEIAVRDLPSQFLFGEPSYLARELRSMREYIHNLLSVWQFFGFFAFAGFIVVLTRSFSSMFRQRHLGISNSRVGHSILLIHVLLSVVTAKSITFKFLWFSLGYWMLALPAFAANQRRAWNVRTLRDVLTAFGLRGRGRGTVKHRRRRRKRR